MRRKSANRRPDVDYTCYDGYEVRVSACGIYTIECPSFGKILVGSTLDLDGRWVRHQKDLLEGTHANPHLQAIFTKYGGLSCLEFTWVELCEPRIRKRLEQEYINSVEKKSCLNQVLAWTEEADGYWETSMDTRINLSRAHGGRPIVGVELRTGFAREWDFIAQAAEELDGIQRGIQNVLAGLTTHHYGWFFFYTDDPRPIPEARWHYKVDRPVVGLDMKTGETRQFDNLAEVRAAGFDSERVSRLCNHAARQSSATHKEWFFRWEDDLASKPPIKWGVHNRNAVVATSIEAGKILFFRSIEEAGIKIGASSFTVRRHIKNKKPMRGYLVRKATTWDLYVYTPTGNETGLSDNGRPEAVGRNVSVHHD